MTATSFDPASLDAAVPPPPEPGPPLPPITVALERDLGENTLEKVEAVEIELIDAVRPAELHEHFPGGHRGILWARQVAE